MDEYENMVVLERARGINDRSHHVAERYIEPVEQDENHWKSAGVVARQNLKHIIAGVVKNG